MPAPKLTPLDREHVAATFAATGGNAAETAARHGLTRKHVNVMAGRYPEFAAARPTKVVTVLPSRRVQTVSVVSAAAAITDIVATNRSRSTVALSSVVARKAEWYDARKSVSQVKPRELADLATAHAKIHPPEHSEDGLVQVNFIKIELPQIGGPG